MWSRISLLFAVLKLKQSNPSDPTDDETYHSSSTADDRSLVWANPLESFPSQELAAFSWPPSVYEAAQDVYPSLSPMQPYALVNSYTMSVGGSWQPSPTAVLSYPDRSRYLESAQVNDVNRMHEQNLFAMSYPDPGPGSSTDKPTPPALESAHDNGDGSSSAPRYVARNTLSMDVVDMNTATSLVYAAWCARTTRHSQADTHRET
jgi:hypothetical protein